MLRSAMALDEIDRIAGIRGELEGIESAWRVAYATHKPEELTRLGRAVRSRMKLAEKGVVPPSETVQAVLAKVAKAERIARRAKRKGR